MPAVVDVVLRGFLTDVNLDHLTVAGMLFAKVPAQSALSIFHSQHRSVLQKADRPGDAGRHL